MSSMLVLDDEAVRALMSAAHPEHRRASSFVQVMAARRKKAADVEVVVPTAVRVQAGWDRTSGSAAFIGLCGSVIWSDGLRGLARGRGADSGDSLV